MDSVDLYRQLLGLTAPRTVERVELDMAKQHVEVHVVHAAGQRFACPECGRELGVYDHLAERVWRHLDSCQFLTYLHARPPRVSCPEHGVWQPSTRPHVQQRPCFGNIGPAMLPKHGLEPLFIRHFVAIVFVRRNETLNDAGSLLGGLVKHSPIVSYRQPLLIQIVLRIRMTKGLSMLFPDGDDTLRLANCIRFGKIEQGARTPH